MYRKLKNFGAANNPLTSFPDFSSNSQLFFIDLSGVQAESLPNIPSNVEIVHFENATALTITKESLENAHSLEYLYLKDNRIYTIEEGAFIGAPNLFYIGLQVSIFNSIYNLNNIFRLFFHVEQSFKRNY